MLPLVFLRQSGYASPVPHFSLSLAFCHIIPIDDDAHCVDASLSYLLFPFVLPWMVSVDLVPPYQFINNPSTCWQHLW
jgi:hypothetical protein